MLPRDVRKAIRGLLPRRLVAEPHVPASEIDREHVTWAYRILLDREPESEEVIRSKLVWRDTRQLRRDFMGSQEFIANNPDFTYATERNVIIKELDGGVRLFVDLADLFVGLNIIKGRYEQDELTFVRHNVRSGQHVLDVGANVGLYAMTMAVLVGPSGHVSAFEPFPGNAELLSRAIVENSFEDRVTLVRAAVGELPSSAMLVFVRRTINSGGAYLQPKGARVPHGHDTEPVPVVTLDDAVTRRPVHFVKIDVEGAEALAFRGATRILREDRPLILSEVHGPQLQRVSGCRPAQLIAEMEARGYACHLLAAGALGPRVRELPDDILRSVVFAPV